LGISLLQNEEKEAAHFEILKENAQVLEAFFILDGCAWQYAGMGDLVGLDYPAAKIIWDYAGIQFDSETFKGIMLFSRTVVEELNKKRSKKNG
jgi:hypothetical protein